MDHQQARDAAADMDGAVDRNPRADRRPGAAGEPRTTARVRALAHTSRPARRAVAVAGAALAASTVAAGAVVVLAAATGSWPWSAAGGVVAALLASAGLSLVARLRARRRSRRGGGGDPAAGTLTGRPVLGPVLVAGCAALLSATWLWPGGAGDAPRPLPVPGVSWLPLRDGTRLAVHVTRAAAASRPPLIVVHGGPGVADMAHDVPAFAPLATDRDVYVYDQIGTGASSRLRDPTGYTADRAVRDLDAVRAFTGAERVALLGHSWGARFATLYLARHPDRVAALVLSAPGELPVPGAPGEPGDPTLRLSAGQRARLYARMATPRNLFVYALTVVDPRVAAAAATERELDSRFAGIYRLTTPALFCDPALADRPGTGGVGHFAHQVPLLADDPTAVVEPAALAPVRVPVLVIKPACDYVPWSVLPAYLATLPTARLVMLPDAGHQAYLERPEEYRRVVSGFLAGGPLPLPTVDAGTPPEGYRGIR